MSARVALAVLSFAAAYISYRWIERPFRRRREGCNDVSRSQIFAGSMAIALILGLSALGALSNGGWSQRFPARVVMYDRQRRPPIPYEACDGQEFVGMASSCLLGNKAKRPRAILWGDSHSLAWAPALEPLASENGESIKLAFKSACPPLVGVSINVGPACTIFVQQAIEWIRRERPQRVYLMASWNDYSNADGLYTLSSYRFGEGNEEIFPAALRVTINQILPDVGQVVLIGPTPGAPSDIPFKLAKAELRHENWPPPLSAERVARRSADFWRAAEPLVNLDNVTVIDPAPWFCDANYCKYAEGATLLYRDNGHLSLHGAQFVESHLVEALSRMNHASMVAGERRNAGNRRIEPK
jgi:hypothetical protein